MILTTFTSTFSTYSLKVGTLRRFGKYACTAFPIDQLFNVVSYFFSQSVRSTSVDSKRLFLRLSSLIKLCYPFKEFYILVPGITQDTRPAGNKRLAPFLCRRRNTEKRRQASAVIGKL